MDVPVATKRKYFSTLKAGLGIVVQIMLLLPEIPIGGSIAGVVVADIISIASDFYQMKDGRRGLNMEMIEKTCSFSLMMNSVSYIVSMALNIASIVTGLFQLQIAAPAFSLFV